MRVRSHAALWLLPLVLFVPALVVDQGALFGSTDALYYTLLMKLSGRQFLMGDFWPRWLLDADAGLGAPLMYAYPPLPYLLTAGFTCPLWLIHVGLGGRMLAGMYLATVASGYSALYWLRTYFPPQTALAAALLYMLLPYRLVYIYLHFNLAQLWALAWLPLWMTACDRILTGRRQGVWAFAICAALVTYSHPLTVLAFGAVPVAYLGWLGRARWRRTAGQLAAALLLSSGLIASYAVSFTEMKQWMIGSGLAGSTFNGGRYSVFNNLSHVDSVFVAPYVAIAVVILLLSRRQVDIPLAGRFWIVTICVLWGLTFQVSAPFWRLVRPLQSLQFPVARLHAGMLVGVAFLAGAYLALRPFPKATPDYLRPAAFWLLVVMGTFPVLFRIATVYSSAAHRDLTADYVATMHQHAIVGPEWYHLLWSDMDGPAVYRQRARIDMMPQAHFMSGNGELTVQRWHPGHISLSANVRSSGAAIAVKQRYIPAWAGLDRSESHPVAIVPSGIEGLLSFTLQQGTHEVDLRLERGDMLRAADWLSLITLGAAVICLSRTHRSS